MWKNDDFNVNEEIQRGGEQDHENVKKYNDNNDDPVKQFTTQISNKT